MSWEMIDKGAVEAAVRQTILLYGDTGDGKTTLLGEWAEQRYIATKGKKMRLYTGDPGGYLSIRHLVKLGVVEVVDLVGRPQPWEWLKHIVDGKVPTIGSEEWATTGNENIDTFAFEGLTAIADILMQDAAKQAAQGRNMGGQPPNFKVAEGEVKWAGNSPSHYGSVQTIMAIAVQSALNNLPGSVIWTASARRAQDADSPNNPILGPQMAGKALTGDLPRWFNFCYRAMAVPADPALGIKAENRLYFDDHVERSSPGTKGLGNGRLPLDSHGEGNELPPYISPASLVAAVALWQRESDKAEQASAKRIAAAGLTVGGNAAS